MISDDSTGFKNQENELDLMEVMFVYIRHWKWFVLSVFVFMLIGYFYVKLETPLYKIETDLLIKDNKGSPGGQNDLLKDLNLFSTEKIIDNEIQILKSDIILEKVATSLKLTTSYINVEGVRKKELYKDIPFEVELLKPSAQAYTTILNIQLLNPNEAEVNGRRYTIGLPLQTEAGLILIKSKTGIVNLFKFPINVKFNDLDDVVQQYSGKLKIDPASKQATVLIITLEDAIPQRGMDFLNKLIEEYNHAAVEDKNRVASNTLNFIEGRIRVIAEELNSVEKNVEHYKSSNRITDVSEQSQIFLQSVQENDAQLSKILIQLNVLKNLENYLHNNNELSSKLPSMLGIEDPTLLDLVKQLGETQLRRLSLLQTVPETNPVVKSFTDQINSLKQAIEASVQNLNKGLEITRQQLEAKNNRFESNIKNVPSKERGLLDVMRQQDIKNNLFTYLLQKREETAMSLASGVADSRTINQAKSSKLPVRPVKSVIYLLFFLSGIILPILIIYLKVRLNFKINRRLDIEQFTKAAIIAEIAFSEDKGPLLVVSKPRSMVAEQIRALRTNLQFVLPDPTHKVILFTSSISGEGKSFISLNLGASLAMSGKKVIILELDLRKPKLYSALGVDNISGLSNLLIGKENVKDIIKAIPSQSDYYILTSGPIPPNPSELLGNGRLGILIEELKKNFDYIILDAPPVGLVTDAQILGAYADATLFIVRQNYTSKSHIHSIDHLYQSNKFRNLNIILNSIDLKSTYGYGYGYGYGYYQENGSEKRFDFLKLFKKD
jgi:tyrosine-protein kinase Etk/Wzc